MRRLGLIIVLTVGWLVLQQHSFGQVRTKPFRSVQFIHDTVLESTEDVITLLGGSKWSITSYAFLLPASKITIVLTDEKGSGIAYSQRTQFYVNHLSGLLQRKIGWLTEVVKSLGDGAFLQLEDGSLWEVPPYDQYDTGYWIPPYQVIVSSDELYMYCLNKGKRIWVSRAK